MPRAAPAPPPPTMASDLWFPLATRLFGDQLPGLLVAPLRADTSQVVRGRWVTMDSTVWPAGSRSTFAWGASTEQGSGFQRGRATAVLPVRK